MNTNEAKKAVEWGKSKGLLSRGFNSHVSVIVKAKPAWVQQPTQTRSSPDKVSCPGCYRIVDVVTFGNVRTYARHNMSPAMGGSMRCNISGREVINMLARIVK